MGTFLNTFFAASYVKKSSTYLQCFVGFPSRSRGYPTTIALIYLLPMIFLMLWQRPSKVCSYALPTSFDMLYIWSIFSVFKGLASINCLSLRATPVYFRPMSRPMTRAALLYPLTFLSFVRNSLCVIYLTSIIFCFQTD